MLEKLTRRGKHPGQPNCITASYQQGNIQYVRDSLSGSTETETIATRPGAPWMLIAKFVTAECTHLVPTKSNASAYCNSVPEANGAGGLNYVAL
jgi:hypothetical protein